MTAVCAADPTPDFKAGAACVHICCEVRVSRRLRLFLNTCLTMNCYDKHEEDDKACTGRVHQHFDACAAGLHDGAYTVTWIGLVMIITGFGHALCTNQSTRVMPSDTWCKPGWGRGRRKWRRWWPCLLLGSIATDDYIEKLCWWLWKCIGVKLIDLKTKEKTIYFPYLFTLVYPCVCTLYTPKMTASAFRID